MKKLLFMIVIIAGIAAGGGFLYQRTLNSTEEISFQMTEVTRGDLENIVSSTGSLSAIGTVDVGSQISGTLEKVLVDYNDTVKKGQILAVVDTTLLKATVRDAEANVMQRQAQLNQAKVENERKQKLFNQKYISEMELLAIKTEVETATASLKSAEASLERAQTNLKYAEIRSPIDGTVIERSVDTGQTIAASLNAPTLFTIAEDLSQMQIEAAVDESDIGQIKENQSVRFSVQAYPDEVFTGTVRQIRLKPTVVQDVVNYTVIVDAPNERGLLLPGMTATVDFLIEQRKDVLLVPNIALHFKPPEEMLARLRENPSENPPRRQRTPGEGTNRSGQQRAGTRLPPDERQTDKKRPGKPARVFYLVEDGTPQIARFIPGVTDGAMTEVVRSRDLQEGMKVITGVTSQKTSESSGFRFPFFGGGRRRKPF